MGVWEEIEFAKKISPIRKLLPHAAGETFRAAGEIEFVFPVTKERHVFSFFQLNKATPLILSTLGEQEYLMPWSLRFAPWRLIKKNRGSMRVHFPLIKHHHPHP